MATTALPVTESSQISQARRFAVERARALGFGTTDTGRVAIVVTELASNLVKHANDGEMIIADYQDAGGTGVEVLALDRGPGIVDIAACRRDGYSSSGSAGQGLGAVARQSQVFDIVSSTELGTAILVRMQAGRPASDRPAEPAGHLSYGAVSIAKPGETACGDSWCVLDQGDECIVLVADGLGHGPLAASAAEDAVRLFRRHEREAPNTILEHIHAGLRHSRGAAVAVAQLQPHRGRLLFCGIGNISGLALSAGQVHRTVSMNGAAGLSAHRIHAFEYALLSPFVLVLHSDGLNGNWSFDRYPGLTTAHPSLIAGVLYRDYARGNDDVTILVVRGATA